LRNLSPLAIGCSSNSGRTRASLLATVALCCALAGCVTSKQYRLADANMAAAKPLGLSVSAAPIDLTLTNVIASEGPGSWKLQARWDEYVVSLVNHGGQPVVMQSARLIDARDQVRTPGDDPWELEKSSLTNWEKYGRTGLQILGGTGAVALIAAISTSSCTATGFAVAACAGESSAKALVAIPAIGLIEILVVAGMDQDNKAKVQHEFQRRRLTLPLVVAPKESLKGSLFFPITPGPKRLILLGRSGEQPLEVALELDSLAGLHLEPGR
jgi:hypothetical protein